MDIRGTEGKTVTGSEELIIGSNSEAETSKGSDNEFVREIVVGEAHVGVRLDLVLAPLLGSRAVAQRLIDSRHVTVNGEFRAKSYCVLEGDRIVVKEQPSVSPIEETQGPNFRTAFEDDYLIIVDKPAGIVVHPARKGQTGTLIQMLADKARGGSDAERPGIVHRLDRDTSGLMVIAKTEQVFEDLKQLIATRAMVREYLALVHGCPTSKRGKIDAPVGRDRVTRTRMSINTDNGRAAITHFEIERRLPTTTLLRVRLQTGRTHQIRVHLGAIDLPVIGDLEYGIPDRFGLKRQFLHAHRLIFDHPETGQQIDISSSLPVDLVAALTLAEAH